MNGTFNPIVAASYSRPVWMPDLSCKVSAAIGGRFLQVAFPGVGVPGGIAKRGCVYGFSSGCRRRMMRRLAQVNCEADLPSFTTLTFPDSVLPIDCKTAKRLTATFLKRLRRELPNVSGFWRVQMKRRKSGAHVGMWVPHIHLLAWGIPQEFIGFGRGQNSDEPVFSYRWKSSNAGQVFWDFNSVSMQLPGECPSGFLQREFVEAWEWISVNWYHVVGSHDPKHMQAGTNIQRVRSWRGVMSYSSLYLSAEEEEDAPLEGRCWGIFNRSKIPWAKMVERDLTEDEAYRIRRIGRRYIERSSGRHYGLRRGRGLTVFCDASRWWTALVNSPP